MIGGPAAALDLRQAAQQWRDLDVRAVDVRIGNAEGCRGLIDILFTHQMAAVSTDIGSLDHEVASNLLLDVSIPLLSVAVGVMNVEQGAGGTLRRRGEIDGRGWRETVVDAQSGKQRRGQRRREQVRWVLRFAAGAARERVAPGDAIAAAQNRLPCAENVIRQADTWLPIAPVGEHES